MRSSDGDVLCNHPDLGMMYLSLFSHSRDISWHKTLYLVDLNWIICKSKYFEAFFIGSCVAYNRWKCFVLLAMLWALFGYTASKFLHWEWVKPVCPLVMTDRLFKITGSCSGRSSSSAYSHFWHALVLVFCFGKDLPSQEKLAASISRDADEWHRALGKKNKMMSLLWQLGDSSKAKSKTDKP